MINRREFCRASLLASAAALGTNLPGRARAEAAGHFDPEAVAFLRGLAADVVAAAHVPPGALKSIGGVNRSGITLITPGGNYFSFWVRDYAMSLDCGLIGPDEMLPQLKLIARTQNGPRARRLLSGAIFPPWAIADHIRMDGKPIYVPGTDSAGQLQGLGPWGPLPSADDHFYFTHIAYALWRDTRDAAFLAEPVDGIPLLDRLMRAFSAVDIDERTGAVFAAPARHFIGFGFDDTIYMLGALCMVTLLRWRAARQLVELCAAAGRAAEGEGFKKIADQVQASLIPLFGAPDEMGGWLRAATLRCRQPDVWATLFALHLGVLPPEAEKRARDTVASCVGGASGPDLHVIEHQGAVRHVPTTHDFSDRSAWEDSRVAPKGQYQNGAYWHTPTGWLIEALLPVAPELARAVFDRYLAHLRQYDYRKNNDLQSVNGDRHHLGAPWECFGLDLAHAQNPVYMTSVTLPLGIIQRLQR